MFVGGIENNNSAHTSGLAGLASCPIMLHNCLDKFPRCFRERRQGMPLLINQVHHTCGVSEGCTVCVCLC